MSPSQDYFDLVQKSEGLVLHPYQDSGGIWTAGYGHTGPAVDGSITVTMDKARLWLAQDSASAFHYVNELNAILPRPLNQHQFDALSDLVFNIGVGGFQKTELHDVIKANPMDERILTIWPTTCIHDARGHELAGLVTRRKHEVELYFKSSL